MVVGKLEILDLLNKKEKLEDLTFFHQLLKENLELEEIQKNKKILSKKNIEKQIISEILSLGIIKKSNFLSLFKFKIKSEVMESLLEELNFLK